MPPTPVNSRRQRNLDATDTRERDHDGMQVPSVQKSIRGMPANISQFEAAELRAAHVAGD